MGQDIGPAFTDSRGQWVRGDVIIEGAAALVNIDLDWSEFCSYLHLNLSDIPASPSVYGVRAVEGWSERNGG